MIVTLVFAPPATVPLAGLAPSHATAAPEHVPPPLVAVPRTIHTPARLPLLRPSSVPMLSLLPITSTSASPVLIAATQPTFGSPPSSSAAEYSTGETPPAANVSTKPR